MKYFLYNFKKKVKLLPIICAIMPIIMGIFYISLSTSAEKISVDIYFKDNDYKNNFLLNIINQTDSTKSSIKINKSVDFEKSLNDLHNNKINILIDVPDKFYNSIISGENKPATIYFAENSQLVKGSFKSLISSAEDMLSDAQTNIYISDNIKDLNKDTRNLSLNKVFLNSILNREDNFKIEVLGKSNLVLSIIYILLLIFSIVFVALKDNNYYNNISFLKVKGHSPYLIELSNIASSALILSFVGTFLLFLINFKLKNTLSFYNFFGILLVSIFISSLNSLLLNILNSSKTIFITLLIIILNIFCSNLIIPKSIFPSTALQIISILPMGLVQGFNIFNLILIFIYSILLLALSLNSTRRKFIWNF